MNQLIATSENDIDAGKRGGQAQQVMYFELLRNNLLPGSNGAESGFTTAA
jgi:hypothetical protein